MDLHIALAVAVLRDGFGDVRRQRGVGEEPPVKLIGRHRADNAPGGGEFLAGGHAHAARDGICVDQHALDIGAQKDFAAIVADQALERRERVLGAAFDDRRAGGFERKGDDLRHLARIGAFRPEPGVQHPRREQRANEFGLVPRLQPTARGAQRFAEETCQSAKAAAPGFARHDLEHAARPERAAKEREQERRVGTDAIDVGGKAPAVAGCKLVEAGNIGLAVHGKNRVTAVGQQHGRGRRRMGKGKAALFQLRPKLGIGGRRQEQYERRRHDVVQKTRRSDLLGTNAAADAVVALEQQDLVTLTAQQGCRHQRIDAASDDDVVGIRHFWACPTSSSERARVPAADCRCL